MQQACTSQCTLNQAAHLPSFVLHHDSWLCAAIEGHHADSSPALPGSQPRVLPASHQLPGPRCWPSQAAQ
jgi:hypothetical protein